MSEDAEASEADILYMPAMDDILNGSIFVVSSYIAFYWPAYT